MASCCEARGSESEACVIDEEWEARGGHYMAVGGHWAEPPHPGWVWIPGHWAHEHRGEYWKPGHWARR